MGKVVSDIPVGSKAALIIDKLRYSEMAGDASLVREVHGGWHYILTDAPHAVTTGMEWTATDRLARGWRCSSNSLQDRSLVVESGAWNEEELVYMDVQG